MEWTSLPNVVCNTICDDDEMYGIPQFQLVNDYSILAIRRSVLTTTLAKVGFTKL